MTFSKTFFIGLAAISLTACQSTSVTPPSDVLLAGVDSSSIAEGSAGRILSTSNPVCLQFYKNTASFASLPIADVSASAPSGPSFGSSLMKTVILGTLAGVASGGVASLGIGSGFAEAAAIGTASQVTYNAGGSVYDSIVGTGDVKAPAVPEVPALTPMQEITKAAASLGCPAPDQAAITALKVADAIK